MAGSHAIANPPKSRPPSSAARAFSGRAIFWTSWREGLLRCSSNKLERDDDSRKSHRALGEPVEARHHQHVTGLKASRTWERHGRKPWIDPAKKRLRHDVLAVAFESARCNIQMTGNAAMQSRPIAQNAACPKRA
jgi:hypothetical protein